MQGKTVIVTGATGGLGREIARGFAEEGAAVVLTYHQARDYAETLAKELGDQSTTVQYQLDDTASAQALIDTALAWSGQIDVLVNNAVRWGSAGGDWESFDQVPEDEWMPALRANIEGAVRLSRLVAPVMRNQRFGRLVHISSGLAVDGMAGAEYYATAKAALHGFNRSLAFALGQHGDILSNVVMPGLTRTDTNGHIVAAAGAEYAKSAPVGRLLDAAEVARTVVYLGSAANTGMTGQVVAVTGGA